MCARARLSLKKGEGDEEVFSPPRFPFGTFPFLPKALVPGLYPPSLFPHLLFILALLPPHLRCLVAPLTGSLLWKMATPGMSWQQHYYSSSSSTSTGKFNTSSSSSVMSSHFGMEYNQDLHLKMSKKIAQLTKVRESPPTHTSSQGFSSSIFLLLTHTICFCMYFAILHFKLCIG